MAALIIRKICGKYAVIMQQTCGHFAKF